MRQRKKGFHALGVPPAAKKYAEHLAHDTQFNLTTMRVAVEQDRNPAAAWAAIDLCIRTGMHFPYWLRNYLGDCAERIISDDAKGRKPRDVLPWALGFDRVRGNALDMVHDRRKLKFALAFAIQIDEHAKASEASKALKASKARETACNEALGEDAKEDDRTLQRWVREIFGLKMRNPSPLDYSKAVAEFYRRPYVIELLTSNETKAREISS